MKFFIYKKSVTIYAGTYAVKIAWPDGGKFSNGNKWHSGWYNWREEPEY